MSLGVGSHVARTKDYCGICKEPIVMAQPIDVFDTELPYFMIGMADIEGDHGLCGVQVIGTARPFGVTIGIRVRNDRAWLIGLGPEIEFERIPDSLWAEIDLDFPWTDSGD